MSETEKHRGKLIRVETYDVGQTMMELLQGEGVDRQPEFFSDIVELFSDTFYEDYLYHKDTDTLWKIEDEELDPYTDLNSFEKSGNEISYLIEFYNGGTYLGEVLEEGITGVIKN